MAKEITGRRIDLAGLTPGSGEHAAAPRLPIVFDAADLAEAPLPTPISILMGSGSMPMRMEEHVSNDGSLVTRLEAVASLNRLLILRAVRAPRALKEIVVRDGGTGAPLSRQSVRWHLDALVSAGLVRAREAEREYGETTEFVVDHQRIFALSEELRGLARLRPTLEVDAPTAGDGPEPDLTPPRPCLILVSGLDIGKSFSLRASAPGQEWTIGRRLGSHVALDFDGSVSGENSVVRWDGARHTVEDVPGSRNGTRVNGALLQSGEPRALAHGDLVGVGRCILVYWA